jgi:hypothetical protein
VLRELISLRDSRKGIGCDRVAELHRSSNQEAQEQKVTKLFPNGPLVTFSGALPVRSYRVTDTWLTVTPVEIRVWQAPGRCQLWEEAGKSHARGLVRRPLTPSADFGHGRRGVVSLCLLYALSYLGH